MNEGEVFPIYRERGRVRLSSCGDRTLFLQEVGDDKVGPALQRGKKRRDYIP